MVLLDRHRNLPKLAWCAPPRARHPRPPCPLSLPCPQAPRTITGQTVGFPSWRPTSTTSAARPTWNPRYVRRGGVRGRLLRSARAKREGSEGSRREHPRRFTDTEVTEVVGVGRSPHEAATGRQPRAPAHGDPRPLYCHASKSHHAQGCIGRPPPPPSRAPSLCPATVPLTARAGFHGICNRQ